MKKVIVSLLIAILLPLVLAILLTNWQVNCHDTLASRGERGQYCTITDSQGLWINLLVTENRIAISKGFEG